MKKLKLDVHALRVESFATSAEHGRDGGTVRGHGEIEQCSNAESCAITACLTCLCPHSGPQPSCDPCSWLGDCPTLDPTTCP